MTQSIFNSVRKLNFYNFKTKYINQNETVGEFFRKQSIADFGSIPEPSCLDYNSDQSLLAIGSKKGLIKIFGYPGVCYSNRLVDQDEIWNIKFIPETNFLVTLTSENKLILWFISSSLNELFKVDTILNLNLLNIDCPAKLRPLDFNNNSEVPIEQNITAIEVIEFTSAIIMGNGDGSLIQLKLDLVKMRKQLDINNMKTMPSGSMFWQIPTKSDVIDKGRIISKLPVGSQNRVVLNTVIHISVRPGSRKQLLIGYRSGCAVIYDLHKDTVQYILSNKVQLNGLSWCPPDPIVQDSFFVSPDANKPQYQLSNNLYSCHEDGSLIMWNIPHGTDSIFVIDSKPKFPLGNNQKCLSISKILWKRYRLGHLIIFAGGLPRADYMTKSTITIMNSDCLVQPTTNNRPLQHIVLDLTSQLIDFYTIDDDETGSVDYLLVLAEEEFFIVDLTKDEWPTLQDQQPYLNCLHSSPITAYHFLSEVKLDWFESLQKISCQKHNLDQRCISEWPIIGHSQKMKPTDVQSNELWLNDLLVIGHGDGTVAFWRLGRGGCIHKISTIKSAYLFKMTDEANQNYRDYEDDVIPFRRTGFFDPCCDDNRLAVQLIHYTGNNILIGGFGGQVVLWGFVPSSYVRHVLEVDLTTHLSAFKWKGCTPFQHVQNTIKTGSQFEPMLALSIFPPSQITALDILEDNDNNMQLLIACGTLHGLVLIGCPTDGDAEAVVITTHCTVPMNSLASQEAALGEGWGRRRTRELKKSLRSSFRRLRRRSTRRMEHPSVNRQLSTNADNKSVKVEFVENEVEYEERAIEDRPKDTANDGLIRCIKINISSLKKKSTIGTSERSLNLFVGTYGGQIIWFQSDNSIEGLSFLSPMNMRLVKHYQFQHRAPILYFNCLNSDPVSTKSMENGKSEYETGLHKRSEQLLVITEEQIRLYAFPTFALKSKIRVTAHDGFRLKNGHIVTMNDDRMSGHHNSKENLICATNNGGQFLILNSANLRKKDVVQFVDKTDLLALNYMILATSFCLTTAGSMLPCGIYYSGQGQVTLFEIVSKAKTHGSRSNDYNIPKNVIS